MDEPKQTIGRLMRRFLSFSHVATLLGFVVDTITLVSILLALSSEHARPLLPTFITPELALGIWVLALYSYLGLLHSYWEGHRQQKEYSERFRQFLFSDLVGHFREPLALGPLVVLALILAWILNAADASGGICGALLLILFFLAPDILTSLRRKPTHEAAARRRVDEKWDVLSKRIALELSRESWVGSRVLGPLAVVWDLKHSQLRYALAKYAAEHPDETAYRKVYRIDDGVCVSGPDPVLIRLKDFPEDEYFYD